MWNVKYYARDNVGRTEPTEELVELGEYALELVREGKTFAEVAEIIKQEYEELFEDVSWGIGYDEDELVITNKKYDYDPRTKAISCSWGYETATIFWDTRNDTTEFQKAVSKYLEKFNETQKFEVYYSELKTNEGFFVGAVYESAINKEQIDEDNETVITNKVNLMKLLEEIIDFIEDFNFEDNLYCDAMQNPYGGMSEDWEWWIEEEKLCIKFTFFSKWKLEDYETIIITPL